MNNPFFYIVDVFTEAKYAGNQLAVFRNCAGLSTEQMQDIAREMHFSETTFILSDEPKNNGYDVRIFTPESELPFAGHPTLGTSFIIRQEIIGKPVETVNLNLQVGQIPVTFKYDGDRVVEQWMRQMPPQFGPIYDIQLFAEMLSLDNNDIDGRFPIQEVSTGVFCFIVPLKSLDALKRSQIAREKYFDLIKTTESKGVLVFAPEAHDLGSSGDLSVRFYADEIGVPEDPATGSANGCLAGYLVEHKYFGDDKIDIRVEQGYEMNRPSLLLHRARKLEDGKIEVNIGGASILIAKGELV
ncbi:MAG: PhzF family phenazine biosynthesis protein [FCB group bacterium]|nr:PhzF family phenazine biosynthesis protein [FCB group bacterium]